MFILFNFQLKTMFTLGSNKIVDLATIDASVFVSTKDEKIKQEIKSPKLSMVFDDDLHK